MDALGVVVEDGAVALAAGVGDALAGFVGGWGVVGTVAVGADGGFFVAFF